MILLNKRITAITQAQRLDAKNLIKDIRDTGHQNNLESSIPPITDLRID